MIEWVCDKCGNEYFTVSLESRNYSCSIHILKCRYDGQIMVGLLTGLFSEKE